MTTESSQVSVAKTDTIELRGVTLEISIRGNGPPLLFLHPAIGLSPDLPVLDMLAEHWTVYAPSHPGFMRSSLPRHFSHVDDLAYFYLDFLAELKLEKVLVVGVSFGAWVAAEMAIKSCERIAGLVLASPVGIKIGRPDEVHVVDRFSMTAEQFNSLAYANPTLAESYPDLSDEDVQIAARNLDAHALYGWLPYLSDPKLLNRLCRVPVPTLVLKGEQDGIITEAYAQEFADQIPNARFGHIPGSGHYPHIEQPKQLVENVRSLTVR